MGALGLTSCSCCSSGVGRTGAFALLYAAVQEVEAGNRFPELPQLVRRMRQQRKHMLPEGAQFHNQTLWGSIGWATPAAVGAAIAAPDHRLILITGEGSHQLTAQEISQFGRFGLKPLIFVLNNDGYLIERLLCKDPEAVYNDLPQWRYAQLPQALGCDNWYCRRVTTCAELDEAIREAETGDRAAYIEIITERYAASDLAKKLGESVATLYSF